MECPTTDWTDVAIPGGQTALAALQGGAAVARDTFDAEPAWLGRMEGTGIDRSGRTHPKTSESGWRFSMCGGGEEILFSVGPQLSAGQCTEDVSECPAVDRFPAFSVDSAALIAAAFPDGGSEDVYDLVLDLSVAPTWVVTDQLTDEAVQVDPQTGLVVEG
jgi:hypothetical protein